MLETRHYFSISMLAAQSHIQYGNYRQKLSSISEAHTQLATPSKASESAFIAEDVQEQT